MVPILLKIVGVLITLFLYNSIKTMKSSKFYLVSYIEYPKFDKIKKYNGIYAWYRQKAFDGFGIWFYVNSIFWQFLLENMGFRRKFLCNHCDTCGVSFQLTTGKAKNISFKSHKVVKNNSAVKQRVDKSLSSLSTFPSLSQDFYEKRNCQT